MSHDEYAQDVRHVEMFLQGKSPEIIRSLIQKMEEASQRLEFEKAAEVRDQIIALRRVLEKQSAQGSDADVDILAATSREKTAAIFMLHIRGGLVQASRNFFPKVAADTSPQELLESFISHYYTASQNELPAEIITSHPVAEAKNLLNLIGEMRGAKVRLATQVKTSRAAWLDMAKRNLKEIENKERSQNPGLN